MRRSPRPSPGARRRPGRAVLAVLAALGGLFVLLLAACAGTPDKPGEAEPAGGMDMGEVAELAESAYASRDWNAAEKHYTVLVREIPQQAEYWFRLANVYARTGRPELAVAAYRETLVRDASHAKSWFNMGIVQLRQAANSFAKTELHVDEGDPVRERALTAYTAILEILGEGGGTGAAPVAGDGEDAEGGTMAGTAGPTTTGTADDDETDGAQP